MIDEDRVKRFAGVLRRLRYRPISFDNPELFPEPDDYIYPNYVFFMVAIDHRTGFEKSTGSKYHGSDLLFYLARKKQIEEPEFFTAKNLRDISAEDIRQIFTFKGVTVRSAEERAFLLRDCAEKLLERYNGDVMRLFKKAEFTLSSEKGILSRLKEFKAYEDPMMKKSFLLLKILKRQGLRVKDPYNLGFPVDSVLIRLALSSRIVEPDEDLMRKIDSGERLTERETAILREMTGKALIMLSAEVGMEPDVLDDILWTYGREIDSEKIVTPLDERVDKEALRDFLLFIRSRFVKKIEFPPTWYF